MAETVAAAVAAAAAGGKQQELSHNWEQDQFGWDTRLRHLSSLCRHGTTAPVSFYGFRKICGMAPLQREDYDVIRVEMKQLVDSVDSIVRRLNETDSILVSGKKVEQDQIRALATTFGSVKDDLDHKEAELSVATLRNRDLAAACISKEAGRNKALEERDAARAVVTSNHRIYSAMENESINMRYDQEMKSQRIIDSQMAELLDHQKMIARLRNQLTEATSVAEKHHQKAQAQLATLEEERSSLEASLSRAVSEAADAAAAAAAALSTEKEAVSALQHKVAVLTVEMEHAREQAAQEKNAAVAASEAAEAGRLNQVGALEAAVAEQTAAATLREQACAEAEAKLAEAEAKLAEAAEEGSQMRGALDKAEGDVEAMREEMVLRQRQMSSDKLQLAAERREMAAEVEAARAAQEAAEAEGRDACSQKDELISQLQLKLAESETRLMEGRKQLDQEVTRRTNAYVLSQADHALRVATEESKVFDKVPQYISQTAHQEKDLNRFLDAATYRLQEVSHVQREIIENPFSEQQGSLE